jgi:hypothetical protein
LPSGILRKFLVSLQNDGLLIASRKASAFLKERAPASIKSLYPVFNIEAPLRYADREFLETIVFPLMSADRDIQNILFVGVEYYTWHYKKQFRDKTFHTMDLEKQRAIFGNKNLHTIGSVTDLKKFFENNYFDSIVINGVIGYGLNSRAHVNQALVGSFDALRPGGQLIIGWNDLRGLLSTPFRSYALPADMNLIDFALEDLDGYKLFTKYIPTEIALATNRIDVTTDNDRIICKTASKHTFDFLYKPDVHL